MSTQTQSGTIVSKRPGGTYETLTKVHPKTTVVTAGMYGINAYEIDPSSNTFYFKGYMWLRWKGDVDPVSSLEFANSVEEWGLTVTNLTEKPQVLADGQLLQTMRVQGRFFQPFDLGNYPLDNQQLQISIEDTVNDTSKIVYVADKSNSSYDSTFRVPGWNMESLRATSLVHRYGSNFGDPELKDGSFSSLTFAIDIQRARNLFWWKLLLPLLLVLITNWLSLLLNPKYVEVRTAMPATALLTTVFLQQASLDAIPQVSSLVLMDLIYVAAYFAIVLTFGQIIWDSQKIKEDDDKGIEQIRRLDRASLVVQAVITVLTVGFLILTHI